jgi:membrane protease YdiL (CAAX protease family)
MVRMAGVISFAAATDMPAIPEQYVLIARLVQLATLVIGGWVYLKTLAHLATAGGKLRHDLFGPLDIPLLAVAITFLGLTAGAAWFGGAQPVTNPPPMKVEQILPGSLSFAIFPIGIAVFLAARNISIVEFFGLQKVSADKALGYALGFIISLLPIFFLATEIAARNLGNDAQLQPLVVLYQQGVKNGDWRVISHTFLAAAVIAPISEEILFRGYLYPGLKRTIGAVPSAIFAAVLFAAIHNNAAGLPGLTLLALALTIAYEWSGSLVVPILMHATFNSISLVIAAAGAKQ